MKKICTKNRIGTTVQRGAGTPMAKALRPHSGNGNSQGIHVATADRDSGSPRQREATRDPLNASASVLEDLASTLGQVTAADHPRTFKLLQSGRHKLTRKLIEEACEVTVEAVKRDPAGVVRESADLLYHLVVLWFHIGIEPIEIWEEMQTRANALGIAEKRPKTAVSEILADKFNR